VVKFDLSKTIQSEKFEDRRTWGIFVEGRNAVSVLVAINNVSTFIHGRNLDWRCVDTFDEQYMKDKIRSLITDRQRLSQIRKEVQSIPEDDMKAFFDVISNIRKFTLSPRLAGPSAFEVNQPYMLLCHLFTPVFHGWVVSPELSSYDAIKGFTRDELIQYCNALIALEGESDNVRVIRDLLNDSDQLLTAYGFDCLVQEMRDDKFGLFFWRSRYDVIHKHDGDLFLLVSDERVRSEMPQATWMLFEQSPESSIYFTSEYLPVENQYSIDRAREWHQQKLQQKTSSSLETVKKAKKKRKNKKSAMASKEIPEQGGPNVEDVVVAVSISAELRNEGQPTTTREMDNPKQGGLNVEDVVAAVSVSDEPTREIFN
jgi:hypothetical protein